MKREGKIEKKHRILKKLEHKAGACFTAGLILTGSIWFFMYLHNYTLITLDGLGIIAFAYLGNAYENIRKDIEEWDRLQ